jgi:hypothetical protein
MIKRRAFLAGALGAVAAGIRTTGAADAADDSLSGAFAELPGVKLWFTDSGGTGVPLVLLHANMKNMNGRS